MNVLKPCPCCGATDDKVKVVSISRDSHWVECFNCVLSTTIEETIELAVSKWNRRVPYENQSLAFDVAMKELAFHADEKYCPYHDSAKRAMDKVKQILEGEQDESESDRPGSTDDFTLLLGALPGER